MFVAVIKCDFCKGLHEIHCRKAGEKAEVPDGWATIVPMVRIKGRPQAVHNGQVWDKKAKDFKPTTDDKISADKLYKQRNEMLRAKFEKNHVCPDCVEGILTGKVSLKIAGAV